MSWLDVKIEPYQPSPWGAPITKGWLFLRWNEQTDLYHGWVRTVGEFTVAPAIVEDRYNAQMIHALRSGMIRSARDLDFHERYYRYMCLRCTDYTRNIGAPGVELRPHDPELETLLNLGRPGRAQVQAPIICDFCAGAIERGGDQEIAA